MQNRWLTYTGALTPLIIGMVALLLYTPPREFAYQYLDQNCRQGYSLYQRLYTDDTPIDVAFLGSSQTMCSISDVLLDSLLRAASAAPLQVLNLGQCRYGRSLHTHFVRELITHFNPKLIVLEVRVEENRFGHMDFGRVADVGELITDPLWVNHTYFKQIRVGLETRFFALRHTLLGYPPLIDSPAYAGPLRFPLDTELLTLRPQDQDYKVFPLQKIPQSGWAGFMYPTNTTYAKSHLQRMAQLCAEAGVELVFFYTPRLVDHVDQTPIESAFYQEMGELWIPPAGMVSAEEYWADPVHVNAAGARKLTNWMALRLQEWQAHTE